MELQSRFTRHEPGEFDEKSAGKYDGRPKELFLQLAHSQGRQLGKDGNRHLV